jgi:hypothetical protein
VTTTVQRTVLVLGRGQTEPAQLYAEDVDGSMSVVVIALGWPLTDAQRHAVEAARALALDHRLVFEAILVGSLVAGVAEISARDRVLLGADRREARRVTKLLRPRLISARVAR